MCHLIFSNSGRQVSKNLFHISSGDRPRLRPNLISLMKAGQVSSWHIHSFTPPINHFVQCTIYNYIAG